MVSFGLVVRREMMLLLATVDNGITLQQQEVSNK
jgi:hypothetical protein